MLLRLKGEGKTIFLNSHLLSELELICDRVAILVKGKVVKQGGIRDLTMDRQRFEIEVAPSRRRLLAGAVVGVFGGRPGMAGNILVEVSGPALKVLTTDAAVIQPMIDRLRAGGAVIRRVQPIRQRLEELFIETVEGAPPSPPPGRGGDSRWEVHDEHAERAMTQTAAILMDAYRDLNSRKMFWVVMILSGLAVVVFALLGTSGQVAEVAVVQDAAAGNAEQAQLLYKYDSVFS